MKVLYFALALATATRDAGIPGQPAIPAEVGRRGAARRPRNSAGRALELLHQQPEQVNQVPDQDFKKPLEAPENAVPRRRGLPRPEDEEERNGFEANTGDAAAGQAQGAEGAQGAGAAPATGPEGGCECEDTWDYKGFTYSGCTASSAGPWCVVKYPCDTAKGSFPGKKGRILFWDTCTMASLGSGAAGADSTPADGVPFFTVNGCHCLKQWRGGMREVNYCWTESGGRPWCKIADENCAGGKNVTNGLGVWDFCWADTPADLARGGQQVTRTLAGCHCMPEWQIESAQYTGCSTVPGEERKGCKVIEDAMCPGGIMRYGSKWDWCDGSITDPLREVLAGVGWMTGQTAGSEEPKEYKQPWRDGASGFLGTPVVAPVTILILSFIAVVVALCVVCGTTTTKPLYVGGDDGYRMSFAYEQEAKVTTARA